MVFVIEDERWGAKGKLALEVYTRDQLPQDWAMTQKNLGNVLEDLGTRTGSEGHPYMIDAYKEIAVGVFQRHPELSALLFAWRHFGLQPSPSSQHEVRAGYVVVPSNNPDAMPLSTEVLTALGTPGLNPPGGPE